MNLSEPERQFIALAEEALLRVVEYAADEWWEAVRSILPRLASVQAKFCDDRWPAVEIRPQVERIPADDESESTDGNGAFGMIETVTMQENLVTRGPTSDGPRMLSIPLWSKESLYSTPQIWNSLGAKSEFRDTLEVPAITKAALSDI